MMNGKILTGILIIFSCMVSSQMWGKEYILASPDQRIVLTISLDETVSFSVQDPTGTILKKISPAMHIGELIAGENPKLISKKYSTVDQVLNPVVPTIYSEIRDHCNQLTLRFRGNYSLVFRAYNNGAAYRFESTLPGEVYVQEEKMDLDIPGEFTSWFPKEESMMSHNERTYETGRVDEIGEGEFCSLPVLFKSPKGSSILFTEADLFDYPGMFLKKGSPSSPSSPSSPTSPTSPTRFSGLFPSAVLQAIPLKGSEDRNQEIIKEADYLAATQGTRNWPWRLFMIAGNDGDLMTNNLVFQLSRPLQLEQTDWIKPGMVAWDWWNANNIYGVDFKAGINNQTYKYYIDFASEFGLEYIILDEGWTYSTTETMKCNPDIDVEELVKYGEKKGVGIILWTLWKPLEDNLTEALDLYRDWGVKGIKVDFMQRSDQYMVNYYERVAKEAGARELLVDYHGAFKPSGLSRAWPNVINYEEIKGMENVKWSSDITPRHDLTIPFIRMAAGPMDFTPGAMDNAHEVNFMARFDRPMSMGTRCHQLAMYVIYTSPLQMLCDNPTNYYRERESAQFISEIPTTWDETRVLEADVADHIVMARRSGENWYIGAMCAGSAKDFELDLSFLEGEEYSAVIMQDGINAEKMARDYTRRVVKLNGGETLKIHMVGGGGWAAILKPLK
jgi:alpha-glucosidase